MGSLRRLDNGLRVVLHRDPWVPLVAVRVRYHVGSVHDPPHLTGLAHLVEHLAFRSLKHIEDGDIERHLHRVAAVGENGQTDLWDTDYYETVPSRELETALWLESERMGFFAKPSARLLADEISVVRAEGIHWHTGDDLEHFEALFTGLFPPPHPYGRRFRGETVASASRDDVLTFAEAYMGPANATLILVGDVPNDVDALVDRYFGDLSGGTSPPEPPGLDTPLTHEVRTRRSLRPGRAAQTKIGWRIPEPTSEKGDAIARVIASIVDGRAPADDLPGVKALSGQVLAGRAGRAAALLITGVMARDEDVSAIVGAIDSAIDAIRDDGVPERALSRAKRRIATDFAIGHESHQGRAHAIATHLEHDPSGDLDRGLAAIGGVTRADVRAFANKYLTGARAVLLLSPGEQGR